MIKKLLLIILFIILFTCTAYGETNVNISINKELVEFNEELGYPFIDSNNRTQVPFRVTLEKFGAEVTWEEDIKSAVAVIEETRIEVPIGENYIIKNGEKIKNDTRSLIKDSRTYLPIRIVLESFGAEVGWDKDSQTVVVKPKEKLNLDLNISNNINYNSYNAQSPVVFNTDGKYLYFSNVKDKMSLYRKPLKSNESEKVFDVGMEIFQIQITENYIFFDYYNTENKSQDIGRINKDGTNFMNYNIDPYRLQVIGGKIYYVEGESKYLASMDYDGNNKEILVEDCDDIFATDNKIFYYENGEIYSIELDGKNKELIEKGGSGLLYRDKKIYYTGFRATSLKSIDLENKSREEYELNREISDYLVEGDYIYYSRYYRDGLYKYNMKTGEEKIIFKGEAIFPNLIGDKIFFHEGYNAYNSYYYDINNDKIEKFPK